MTACFPTRITIKVIGETSEEAKSTARCHRSSGPPLRWLVAARRDSLAATLAAITEAAPALRKAGVLTVAVGGVAFTLAPNVEPPPDEKKQQVTEPDWGMDPLNDPSTYVGGRVPGFTREDA